MVFGSKVREKGALRKVARPARPGAGRLLMRWLVARSLARSEAKRALPPARPLLIALQGMTSSASAPRRRAALASLLLLAAAPALAGEPRTPEAVVAAERAFAAETLAKGFKKAARPRGGRRHPVPAGAGAGPAAAPSARRTRRDPAAAQMVALSAGIATSGDLGFTTGGANIPVRYFTVWKKQPDGSWKWIYDGGPRLAALLPGSAESVVAYLPPATAAAGSTERALAEIAPLEADLAATAAEDAAAAHLKYLAEDGLVAGSTEPTRSAAPASRQSSAAAPARRG